jgi:hypothetical protein
MRTTIPRLIALCTLLLGALAFAPAASAAGTLDQHNDAVHPTSNVTLDRSFSYAQTFVAGSTGHLDQVDLGVARRSSPGDLTVEIQTVAGGLPTGHVVGGDTLPEGNVSTALNNADAFVSIPLSSPAIVVSGRSYAIVLRAGGDGENAWYTLFVNSPSTYANGSADEETAGRSWGIFADQDLRFRTYVTATTDTTAPTTTATYAKADTTAYTPGTWTNQAVTVTLAAGDNSGGEGLDAIYYALDTPACAASDAGIASCTAYTAPFGVAADGAHTLTYFAVDKVANDEAAHGATIKVDQTAPTASPTPLPAANGAGWNNGDVTVTWNWADNPGGSGVDAANCTTSSTSSGEGGAIKVSATCTDLAGNTGSTDYTVKVDKTAPTISAAATTAPNGAGWYNGDVTIRFTCTDALSGIPVCPADQTLSTEGTAVASSAQTVADAAGNTSDASNSVTVKIDKTAPTGVSGKPDRAPDSNGWYNHSVAVTFTGQDATSGIASCTSPSYGSPDSGSASVAGSCTDNAGNVGNGSFALKYDATAPTVAYSAHPATYTADQAVSITCTAADATSLVASTTCQNISGPAYTFNVGANAFSATATDNAGNVGTGQTSFTVTVSAASLNAVITKLVTDQGMATSLQEQANSIASAPNGTAKAGKVNAFIDAVNAQTGKSITAANAAILIKLANGL